MIFCFIPKTNLNQSLSESHWICHESTDVFVPKLLKLDFLWEGITDHKIKDHSISFNLC